MPPTPAPGPALPPPVHDLALPAPRQGGLGVRVRSGVPYAALPGSRPLELDLYLPPAAGSTPYPVVVFLHGGGWRVGSRHGVGPAYVGRSPTPLERLAAGGVAVASVDYRLSAEATWPAQLYDVSAAVRWLRHRPAELGIDPSRVAAWGESAGGHLALLLALTGPESKGEVGVTGPPADVAAAVGWYAPSDLPGLPADTGSDPAAPDSREALLLGAPVAAVPDLARGASPLGHVHPGAAPILLIHGQDDRLVPVAQSIRLHQALREAGVAARLELLPGAGHMWVGSPAAAEHAVRLTVDFLRQALASPTPDKP